MVQNIFKYAAKHSLRFPYKGAIAVEDLFKLDITELDTIYKTLRKHQKDNSDESLIEDKTPQDTELEVKIAIVKEIFEDKKKAADRAKKAAEKKAEAQKIMAVISRKQDEELQNMSIDELQTALDNLSDNAAEEDE